MVAAPRWPIGALLPARGGRGIVVTMTTRRAGLALSYLGIMMACDGDAKVQSEDAASVRKAALEEAGAEVEMECSGS